MCFSVVTLRSRSLPAREGRTKMPTKQTLSGRIYIHAGHMGGSVSGRLGSKNGGHSRSRIHYGS